MVQIKGIREGLLISLGAGDWPEVSEELYQEINRQGEFLQGAKLILDVDSHVLNASTLGKLRDDLSEKGLSLWAVLSLSPITQQNARVLGLATRIHESHQDEDNREHDSELTGEEGILIRRTLRSGHNIEHSGHVTVIGDVNPGAEIMAGGDIVIWGRLSGMAHAGADGNEDAVICAIVLSPTQLRIAGKIAIPPQERGDKQPEMALIQDDKVVAQPWQTNASIRTQKSKA